VRSQRDKDFGEYMGKIDRVINQDKDIYEKQQQTRTILYKELNRLKERVKLEVDSRKHADEEISVALDKYQELISKEVETKRHDIKGTKTSFFTKD